MEHLYSRLKFGDESVNLRNSSGCILQSNVLDQLLTLKKKKSEHGAAFL